MLHFSLPNNFSQKGAGAVGVAINLNVKDAENEVEEVTKTTTTATTTTTKKLDDDEPAATTVKPAGNGEFPGIRISFEIKMTKDQEQTTIAQLYVFPEPCSINEVSS